MGSLPVKYRDQYVTPTLMFYLEIAKLGHLHKLNAKEVNEILSNNKGYLKEIFDMFNYLMMVMFAIEQQRDRNQNRKQGAKSPEFLAREMFGDIMNDVKKQGIKDDIVTIEVTPEDTQRMKAERKKNRPNQAN